MGSTDVEDTDEAAVGAVASIAAAAAVAVDADVADTVLDMVVVAHGSGRNTGVVLCRAVNAAGNGEVPDGGIVDAIERGTFLVAVVFRSAEGKGEGLAVAVKIATERMVVGTHPLVDGNIGHQLEILAAVVVDGSVA